MIKAFTIPVLTSLLLLGGLSACKEQSRCPNCGVIQSIEPRQVKGDSKPAAAIAGAIVGGVIGHQFGSGSGNDAATAAGAIGGAVAGNEVDRRRRASTVYDVVIDMDQGGTRELTLASLDGLHDGAKVRVTGDQVLPQAADRH